ncbi:MAG TPA: divergent PAP2 family protein [Candidatus Paceibacterota bacterium]
MNNTPIYVLAPLVGWLSAHLVKFILALVASDGKNRDWRIFYRAGGMPSSHTAVMVATLTVIGARQGLDSAVFGLGTAVAAIIIYDALNVRRSVGEQADLLRKVASRENQSAKFYVAYGHTLPEVIIGAIIGLSVGIVLLQIL